MTFRALMPIAIAALASCAGPEVAMRDARDQPPLPPMRTFATVEASPPGRANADITRDFLDLSFRLESGRELERFTRFEGPVTLRVAGPAPQSLDADLSRLLDRLRGEARIDITRVPADQAANVTVEIVPRAQMRRAVPAAACFVVPRIADWADFLRNRRGPAIDWSTLEIRERLAIFIPGDVAPQEVRDCLHEELAQALGPLNDLYRLPDSVFNDDNFHTVLTGFDMLILRATYSGDLRSGMTRAEVARRLPRILARLNPAGKGPRPVPAGPTPRIWIEAIETAFGPDVPSARRQVAAMDAVAIAGAERWEDVRLAFSLYALGRLSLGDAPDLAFGAFLRAAGIYGRDPATRIHGAHIAMQIAAFALASGEPAAAVEIVDANTDAVIAAQNAALLSTLLMVKSEALRDMGREGESQQLRTEALGWARYGYGDATEIRRRAAEIAAITPQRREAGS